MKTNKNSVRRSLIVSATALVLTVAMLIGTTFAWFTDSVTSGRNKIQAGNLDVELEYKNSTNTDFAPVTNDTKIFSDSEEGTLWEPGHVEYAVLKVTNAGTLALKYNLGVNVVSENESISVETTTIKLSDYLNVAILDGDVTTETDFDRDTLLTKVKDATSTKLSESQYAVKDKSLYPKGTEGQSSDETVTMVIWMPTDVGNEANYVKTAEPPTIDMGINLVATQYTYEEDSFGSDYDEGATYRVVDAKDIADSINNAKPGDTLKVEGTVTADNFTGDKLTINKDNITVENLTSEVPVSITADDVTLKGASVTTTEVSTPALTVDPNLTSVTVTDSTFSARTGSGTNHTAVSIPINGKVVFTGNTVKNNYNGIEFGISGAGDLGDGTIIANNTFDTIGNNAISIYNIEDGATITIKNNVFKNAVKNKSVFIRLSNPRNVSATFNIEGNNIDTENSWNKIIVLLEDYSAAGAGIQDFTKFTINFKDNTTNSDENKVNYTIVYDDQDKIITTNQPTVNK